MAPTDVSKATLKVQRVPKTIAVKSISRSSPATARKKTISSAKKVLKTPIKMNNTLVETRQRTNTVPKVNTPKPRENMASSVPPNSARKSTWKRRPKAAHSGVPVPEKMKALMKQCKDLDDSL